jgi:hypothetical protein
MLDETSLDRLYSWVDGIPLSRPKKNMARDFSDGVLMADILCHFFPGVLKQHVYEVKHSTEQKVVQWNLINCNKRQRILGIEDFKICYLGRIFYKLGFILENFSVFF